MKQFSSFAKMMVACMLLLASGSLMAAVNENNIHNDVVENGKVVSREVFEKSDSGILTPVKKYNFDYNLNNEMTQKVVYKWDSRKSKWTEESQTIYTYLGNELTMEYHVWDKSSETFVPTEKQVTSSDGNTVTRISYKMNKRTNTWEPLKNGKGHSFDTFALN